MNAADENDVTNEIGQLRAENDALRQELASSSDMFKKAGLIGILAFALIVASKIRGGR